MPGIAGIISRRPSAECQRLVQAMVASMRHEPDYVSGTSFVPELGVYAGWVAHQNSFAASQPVVNLQGDILLVIAGECFLDAETRLELSRDGHTSASGKADWMMALYEKWGDQFWARLNGLFSGLLVDRRRKTAFLFNDRYGMERIYWSESPDAFYFASEAKALLRIRPELREFDPEGVAQHVGFGCTLEWRSLFRGVHLLPGGSLWSFANGTCRKNTYFSPSEWESKPLLSAADFEARLQQVFKRILPRYFETDARIGISLTAGLDSRMIMACLPPTTQKPLCYTFTGPEGKTLDDRLGARVAAACGLEHHLLRLGADFFSDFASHADRANYLTDGSFGTIGAHEIYLAQQARRLSPVRLTGVFGGEVLRGVSFLKPVGLSPDLLNPELNRCIETTAAGFASLKGHPFTFGAFKNIPWNLYGSWAASRSQFHSRSPYLDNELVALTFQTPEDLRRSPRPALRLVRDNSAVLDIIPTDRGYKGDHYGMATSVRRLFAEVTFKMDYMQNEGLPDWLAPADPLFRGVTSALGIFGLHKFLHYRSWFRHELAPYASDVLAASRVRECRFWNQDFLGRLADQHRNGRKNYVNEISAVLNLEAVERLLFKELPRGAGDAEIRPEVERPALSPVNK
jgi:asparagine synthase (glutamine-hydrolysing)